MDCEVKMVDAEVQRFPSLNRSKAAASSSSEIATKTPSRMDRRVPPSVVVIDDEDDDERGTNDAASANSSPKSVRAGEGKQEAADDDDDDCKIMGARRKVAAHFDLDLSDCEVCEDEIRRHWEEAALRKRVHRPTASKFSRVGKPDFGKSSNTQNGRFEKVRKRQFFKTFYAESVSTSASGAGDQGNAKTRTDPGPSSSEMRKTPDPEVESTPKSWPNGVHKPNYFSENQEVKSSSVRTSRKGACKKEPADSSSACNDVTSSPAGKWSREVTPKVSPKGVIFREEIKESAEYQKANEEEWARRQVELQKQAQEAQKLRKRKKAEADRRLEIENRQKQRVETMREAAEQEVKNIGVRDEIRARVQVELEEKAAGCLDLATLLRRLGIVVEGGVQCTPEQVNSAYKRALFKFHPDRTSGSNDVAAKVWAEETFKLISRMKSALKPVSVMAKR